MRATAAKHEGVERQAEKCAKEQGALAEVRSDQEMIIKNTRQENAEVPKNHESKK